MTATTASRPASAARAPSAPRPARPPGRRRSARACRRNRSAGPRAQPQRAARQLNGARQRPIGVAARLGHVKRLSSWALPIILGVAGVALIIIGTLGPGGTTRPRACRRSPPPTPVAQASPTPSPNRPAPPRPRARARSHPRRRPRARCPTTWWPSSSRSPSVGINVLVQQSTERRDRQLPAGRRRLHPAQRAPARPQHELVHLRPRAQHAVQAAVERADRRRGAGPDVGRLGPPLRRDRGAPERRLPRSQRATRPRTPPTPPLALQIHDDCEEAAFWTAPTDYERLTLQTSQGYNRNWGELVVIAEPAEWLRGGAGCSAAPDEPGRDQRDQRHAQRDARTPAQHAGRLALRPLLEHGHQRQRRLRVDADELRRARARRRARRGARGR